MNLPIVLDHPLVSLDLETTGVIVKQDRVVQIGVVKLTPDGTTTEWEALVNPTIPIPKEASDVHGITDAEVHGAPTFKALHLKIAKGLDGCDLCGYNLAAFDVPILTEEFRRCGYAWRPGRIVDAFKIFQRLYPRNLSAAVETFLGEKMIDAHSALSDARAAMRVLGAQLLQHDELPRSVQGLHDMFFVAPRDANSLDPDGKIVWKGGEAALNFGKKHPGCTLREVAALDRGYLEWIAGGTNSEAVQRIVTEALEGRFPVKT